MGTVGATVVSRINAHQSSASGTVDWLSPPEWLRALGPFDLDPCCPPLMPWKTATVMLTEQQDGMWTPWEGRVWCNPPYGPPTVIDPWLERMALHDHGTLLTFARTETRAWFRFIWPRAIGILFVEGRPHFHLPTGERAPGNSGGPVALCAFGEHDWHALDWAAKSHQIPGWLVKLR